MWGTVLALALLAAADPVRIGIAVVLASRARPVPHLVALWLGGMAVAVAVGLLVLLGLHDLALGVIHRVQLATASSTVGQIQIAMGALALILAASITVGFSVRERAAAAVPADGSSYRATSGATWGATSGALSRLSTRAVGALQSGPPWMRFLLGVGLTTDFRYLAVLTAILASGAAAGVQFGAAAVYTLVGLAFAEIPLVSQLAAPATTRAVMLRVHGWVKARRRTVLGVVVAVFGVFLMTTGLGHV